MNSEHARSKRNSSDSVFANRLDVIQDLDLYFVKQIAHSLQEYDLEQKIDLEIRMREGTTKLLAACKHIIQSLEAAKSLLTSNERMTAYLSELQRQKITEKSVGKSLSSLRIHTSKAKVAVSDIRMPLMWKDTDHFKNKGDCRRFAVFCLLKIGTEIYDTALVSNIDRNVTDISFDDVIIFNNVPADFEFHLELYSHILQNDFSIASAPHKIKKKITNSVSRTIGRKLAASLKEDLNSFEIGPKFELVAQATLRLSDASDNIQIYDLSLEHLPNHHDLPLFGHFCCRLAVQPDTLVEEMISGYLSLIQKIGNVTGCRRMWCSLKNCKLSFWTKAEEWQLTSPAFTICLDKNTVLCKEKFCSNYLYSFSIKNNLNDKIQEHVVAADSETDYLKWINHIGHNLKDYELWGHTMESLMDIPSPAPCRSPFFFHERQGSLYEEIPIKDLPISSGSNNNRRLSSPSFRSRSSSTSSTSSSTSSCRHYPFLHSRKQSADSVFY